MRPHAIRLIGAARLREEAPILSESTKGRTVALGTRPPFLRDLGARVCRELLAAGGSPSACGVDSGITDRPANTKPMEARKRSAS